MDKSTKILIEEKEAKIRELQKEIEILKSLPPNGIILDLSLEEFDDLPKCIVNSLKKEHISTAKDLIHKSESEIAKIRNIGELKLEIIMQWLKYHDLQLLKK